MGCGSLSAMMSGDLMKPGWCADNWDTPVVQHMEVLFMVQALSH